MVASSSPTSADQALTLTVLRDAEAAGARVLQRAFDTYARQRNYTLEQATGDWLLFVDADERVPAGERLEEGHAERVDVGRRGRLLAGAHLRGHVRGRSGDGALRRHARRPVGLVVGGGALDGERDAAGLRGSGKLEFRAGRRAGLICAKFNQPPALDDDQARRRGGPDDGEGSFDGGHGRGKAGGTCLLPAGTTGPPASNPRCGRKA